MMKTIFASAALVLAAPVAATAVVGEAAPAITATDSNGRSVSLSDYRGKTVVLEWTNPDCPFVQKHYSGGDMQKLQADARKQGAVWLTVNSGAPGKQGHLTGAAANAKLRSDGAQPTAYLLDSTGSVGRAYGARTTPHMFVIAPDGTLAYAGGIDSIASANPADIAKAEPLTRLAISQVAAGKPVATATSRPYGCSVKY